MKFLWLIGDSAVGKMTVGQALTRITPMRLFHNHMTIEPVLEVFGTMNGRAVSRLRDVIFEEFAASDAYGLIFTYMWAFDMPSDWDYVRRISDLFTAHGATIYCAELVAPQEVRLARNATENRLLHKASKRDVEVSNWRLKNDNARYRLESREGELPFEHYIKINNAELSPEEAARRIQEVFGL
jgi:hypothetical protein